VSAVHHARATGEGQFLDVAMYDAMLAFCETVVTNYGYTGVELGPRGKHHPNLMPFGIFPARDGSIALAAPGPGHWAELCRAIGRVDLIDDARTKNTHVRRRNQAFVEEIITTWTQARTKQEIIAAIGGKVPCGPVNTAAEIFADPHVEARDMIRRFQLPGDNPTVAITGTPIKFTATATGLRHLPPKLGEHTEEVLDEFGITRHKPA
jgi:crotonobetainyl-CoA:carnitine CoA-transferase CaiB-like acyl-CoA transferase